MEVELVEFGSGVRDYDVRRRRSGNYDDGDYDMESKFGSSTVPISRKEEEEYGGKF